MSAPPRPVFDDYKVEVWRTGRYLRPWEVAVYHGPGKFGEPGCDWSAWTRTRALRKGLRVVAGSADFGLSRGDDPVVRITERRRES